MVLVTSILTNKLRNMQKKYWGGKSASLMRQYTPDTQVQIISTNAMKSRTARLLNK